MDRPAAWRAIAVDLEAEGPFRVGGATVDPVSRDARYAGKTERLQPQHLKVLLALARRKGEVVTRSELIDSCWGGRVVGEDVINRSISILRDFAERAGGFEIETVPKAGYRLMEAHTATVNVKGRRVAAAGLVLLVACATGLSLIDGRAERSSGDSAGRAMQVRLAGFTAQSADIPTSFLQSLRDETVAAFADDGAIGVTTGAPGKTPEAGGYQMSGSVQRQGTGYKVILRVDNAISGASLWSRAFDYPAGDRNEMARVIALDLANMARCGFGNSTTYPKTLPDETLRLIFARCENDGTINWELDRALDYARRATIASPDYSFGWSGIAGVAVTLLRRKPPAESAALELEAKRALDNALRLDPRNSEAWALRSYVMPASQLLQREDSLKRAIAARPLDCGCEHHAYGLFLSQVGRLKDAEREFQRGVDIMHLNDGLYANLARAQFAVGDPTKALETLAAGKRVSRNPDDFDLLRAQFAVGTGDHEEAVDILNSPGLAANQDARLLAQVADVLQSRDGAEIARVRESILSLTRDPVTNRPLPATLLATLGDTNGALAAVQRLALTNPAAAYRTLFDPALARAHHDDAFWDTARKLGLFGYWQKSRKLPDLCELKTAPPACSSLN